MSQYKISKKRLAEIIKEEYQSLHEANPLMQNINRWSEEDAYIPLDRMVGRADRSDQLNAILDATSTDLSRLQDVISYFVMKADADHVTAWLDERGLMGGPGATAANRKDEALTGDQKEMDEDDDGDIDDADLAAKRENGKAMKKESLATIRGLIQQELQNL